MKFITKNSSAQAKHTLEHQTTQEPLVITDCLQTQREDTLKDKCAWKRMAVDSRCRVDKKKEKGGRNLRLCCAWKHCRLGLRKSMHVAQIPFLSILAPAKEELQLKLIEELHSSSLFGLPKHTALSAVVLK